MYLHTFGELSLIGGEFQRPKPLLLLAYLAVEGSKPRRHLAELFYRNTSDPLNSLSRALSHLRAVAPELIDAGVTRVDSAVGCDANDLIALLDRQREEEAIALYRGAFLHGADSFEIDAELEEWIYETREYFARRVRAVLIDLAEAASNRGDRKAATRYAEKACTLPGSTTMEPEEYPRLYRLLSFGHSAHAAMIRKEAKEFDIDLGPPGVEPRPLQLKKADSLSGFESLPIVDTSFVGRTHELGEVVSYLQDAQCRCLTLHGPPGVGKSRMALEAVRLVLSGGVVQEVAYCNLDALTAASQFIDHLAASLDLNLPAGEDAVVQVRKHLETRRVLIVLDNFETVIEAAPRVADLLSACRRLTALVTSRERLNIVAEWVYPLTGLPVTATHGLPDAVDLFVRRAKRSRLDFPASDDTLEAAAAIGRLVDGAPLAIELAASLTKAMSVPEIAREIHSDFSVLNTTDQDVPPRHRSIRAALESSWRLLDESERAIMCDLAVCRGGFRIEAARDLAGATLPNLIRLIDRSLLRTTPSGRYDRHLLLYEFTREQARRDPERFRLTEERHAHHYLRLAAEAETDLRGDHPQEAMARLTEELQNFRAAWTWAVEERHADLLESAATPLRIFFDKHGRFAEGLDMIKQATAVLDPAVQAEAATQGVLLIQSAWLAYRLGRYREAETMAVRGMDLLRPHGGARSRVEGLHILGALRFHAGALVRARHDWTEALQLARKDGNQYAVAQSLDYLGIVEENLGNYQRAKRFHQASLDLTRQLGNRAREVTVLNNYGTLALLTGDLAEAEILLEEGLETARRIGAEQDIPYLLNNRARVHLAYGEHEAAGRLGREALEMARRMREGALQMRVLVETLGPLGLATGDLEASRQAYHRCLALAWTMHSVVTVLEALVGIAQTEGQSGNLGLAGEILTLVETHFAASPRVRGEAESVRTALSITREGRGSRHQPTLEKVVGALLDAFPVAEG